MHQVGEGQHERWLGHGVLEHLCVETHKHGASNEKKAAADPFSKLLAGFEAQELPPTLHQSSVLTPSKRQRKSYRPSRIPPTYENPVHTDEKRSQTGLPEGTRMYQTAFIKQQPPASLQACEMAMLSDTQESKTLKPSLPRMKGFSPMDKQLQNRMQQQELPSASMKGFSLMDKQLQNGMWQQEFPSPSMKGFSPTDKQLQNEMWQQELPPPTMLNCEQVITHQETGWNLGSSLPDVTNYALTDDKLSHSGVNNGTESFTYLLNLQQNEKSLDPLCGNVCRNLACQAQISLEASFCRRCSCCICKLFDDNKDPSLWILCGAMTDGGCGLSCHIECALKQRVAGVVMTTDGRIPSLDGGYFCESCSAVTPLIGCWKEQLLVAKVAQTVDVFQYRLLLSFRLLKGTKCHEDAHGPIEEAIKKLDAELSHMVTSSVKLLRCSVDMLSCKVEVQRLITLALEKADTGRLASVRDTKQAGHSMAPCMITFEDVSSSSIVVTGNDNRTSMKPKLLGYKLWHRKASEATYARAPTSILYNADNKFVVSNLLPLTVYTFKVVPFSMEGDLAMCEAECSTKGVEQVEVPVDVYASLDVVLINAKRVEGTSRCMNQVFSLDYHIDKRKNGLKIQDLEEVLVDQNEQAHHVSSVSPSTRKGQKDNCELLEGLRSPHSKIGASTRNERGGHGAHLNMAGVQQDKNLHTLDALGPFEFKRAVTGTENLGMRKSPCVSLNCQDDKLPRQSHPCSSELKTTNKQEFLLDTVGCRYSTSVSEKTSTTKVLKCDRPSQRWVMQVHGSDNSIKTSTQADVGIIHGADNHMQGIITCNGEAEFSNYEFSVKVIRWLECEGHLKEEFRMKFLTWYTLRASEHEKKVVSVFIDTLQDDPASLAGQLVDAFEDIIGTNMQPIASDGYCRRLW
eukprot:c17463_g1_i1 orf=692-3421(+)